MVPTEVPEEPSKQIEHKPLPSGSGHLKCSCGYDFGHFVLDSDMWEAWDVHILGDPEVWSIYEMGMELGNDDTIPDNAPTLTLVQRTTEALKAKGWVFQP